MKKTFGLLVVFALFLSVLSPSLAYAKCRMCPMSGKGASAGHGYGGGWKEEYKCPVTAKFMYKAGFYLENEKELGFSEEQVNSIKALKHETKKAYIRQTADYQVFGLDLYQKLSEPKVDVTGINKMIDQQSASMTASAKETIVAYAKLKSVLTDEQQAKAKELWSARKG